MKRLAAGLMCLGLCAPLTAGENGASTEKLIMASAFDPGDVTLLESPFTHSRDLDVQYLLKLEPDRFLAWFRKEAGLAPRAEAYPGWESRGIAGHSLGHYLSACAMAYATTHDEQFLNRVAYIVKELGECQKARGTGYVGAIPGGEKQLDPIRNGDICSQGFDLNGMWVPFYTIHKILAGLRDAHRYAGSADALKVELDFADWIGELVKGLDTSQMQRILAAEHGGMNEVLADLYADTGEQRYLDLAERFHHDAVLDPLGEERDVLAGLHANTQIPKIIGLARLYEVTGKSADRKTAEFFWNRVVHHHSYANGGNSMAEHFGEADHLNDRLSLNTAENCNVYNMLKLSDHLFQWEPRGDVGDFMERALYGQILASQHPEHATMTYFMSLAQGGFKDYNTLFDMFTCCIGTGMENHVRYQQGIYYDGGDRLFVNLFIPSELRWKGRNVTVRTETSFPESEMLRMTFSGTPSGTFSLHVRRPSWAGDVTATINGSAISTRPSSSPGFLEIDHDWKDGDAVELRFPMQLRAEAMPDNSRRLAFLYGPTLLAGDLGEVNDPKATEPDYVPAIVTARGTPRDWFERDTGGELRFTMKGVGAPRNVSLVPFWRIHDRRYTVYWDVFTPKEWATKEGEYLRERERLAALEARTTDMLQPGEMQPERDHNQQGENTEAGSFGGRKFRHAIDGWFSYDLACDAKAAHALVVTYYGGETGDRAFDISVDGRRLIEEKLYRDKPDKFLEREYLLPESMTLDKKKITVRFAAHPGNWAGGVYGLRLVRTELPARQPSAKSE